MLTVSASADPAYMKCVANVLRATREGSLVEAADVFLSVIEQKIGGKATTLREFAEKHLAELTVSAIVIEWYPRVLDTRL